MHRKLLHKMVDCRVCPEPVYSQHNCHTVLAYNHLEISSTDIFHSDPITIKYDLQNYAFT